MDKGITHESDCLVAFRSEPACTRSQQTVGEPFADWVERVGNPLEFGFDVIYQMPLVHDGVRRNADFLVRRDNPESGRCQYEPVDAKLARSRRQTRPRTPALFLRRGAGLTDRILTEIHPPLARLR